VKPVHSNGFFLEHLGTAHILDHYHRFIFYSEISKLETSYTTLKENLRQLQSNEIDDKLTFRLKSRLISNIKEIRNILDKLSYKRVKRGLFNAFGNVIKFITGNLDNDDLQMIMNNLKTMKNLQNSAITKINQISSFANHVSQRFAQDAELINSNINNTIQIVDKLKNTNDLRVLIENEIFQSQMLLSTLKELERAISLSFQNIPDLEIMTVSELLSMHKHLEQIYHKEQLLPFDEIHLYQLLECASLSIVAINETITFIFKVPILKPYLASYSQLYPVPNSQNIIISPPKKYVLQVSHTELWTDEDCQRSKNIILCLQQPIQSVCSTLEPQNCTTIQITNPYKLVQVLHNNELLTLFHDHERIVEDCNGLLTQHELQGANIISSTCRIIISTSIYSSTNPSFELETPNVTSVSYQPNQSINLRLNHLKSPMDLEQEARSLSVANTTPVEVIHYAATTSLVSISIALFVVLCLFKNRLYDLFIKPRTIIHLERSQPEEKNEGVLPTNGGGVIV
jgi:hypothetical protein